MAFSAKANPPIAGTDYQRQLHTDRGGEVWAERVLAAFNASRNGVVQIDGVMLDAPHRTQAERIMASVKISQP
jgi:citrate lyase beta subunit